MKAVVLLSGGLDSVTTLAIARNNGYACYALSIDYGQRHASELAAAAKLAQSLAVDEHKTIKVDLTVFGGSALTNKFIAIPAKGAKAGIPATYVPARNTIMLSLALAWAEVLESRDIFVGVNAVDYSGYPDCRPEYIAAFEKMANLATKAAIEGARLSIHAPLINLSKAEIIRQGILLGVDYSLTVSCYQADEAGLACGVCDACRLRRGGFEVANVPDPTRYKSS
ncbi:preQ(0) biosynthesis protein QueC [Nitrosospira sp. Nl5]|uniref:7-cyano-7-deazaguanine synthase QueC n=1 Tax=Nitrosospira sp. Nl5 TaxID=200120 RepID=UPI000882964E|nr:7-cyano-7-deazaguanine synthase QueC [Nitrosospira sp. Nl5]SCY67001.1 preQ(0) biosynthesis protein QueC [Nitrosospira sp. Nl5]